MPEADPEGRRICLFGGTFDPIHEAHLRIAEEARKAFSLDRILFIPAGTPPHKANTHLTPYRERLRMVEIACAPFSGFEVSRLEDHAGPSYTIDTVRRFRETMPVGAELFFLIGADAFNEIETWKNWRELLPLIAFIVVARPLESYRIPAGATVLRLDGVELPISSSSIRSRLMAGEPVEEVPARVRAYIEERGLYGSSRNEPIASQ